MGRAGAFGCHRSEPGGAAIEFALTLPLFLVGVLGLLEFARAMWILAALNYAVDFAARYAAINQSPPLTIGQIQSYAAAVLPGIDVNAASFGVDTASCGVRVSISVPLQLAVPWLPTTALTISAQSCYPVTG